MCDPSGYSKCTTIVHACLLHHCINLTIIPHIIYGTLPHPIGYHGSEGHIYLAHHRPYLDLKNLIEDLLAHTVNLL